MSEKLTAAKTPEKVRTHTENFEDTRNSAERQAASAEELKLSHEKQKESLQTARHQAKAEAKRTEDIAKELPNKEDDQPKSEVKITREIKEMAYQRLLHRARRHMSPYERLMSRVIHQPAVDTIAEVTGKTIGRPSGILGGGVVAFLGTCIYYYLTKHYGYNYNAFVFLLLLILGFMLGWTLELLYRFFKILHRK